MSSAFKFEAPPDWNNFPKSNLLKIFKMIMFHTSYVNTVVTGASKQSQLKVRVTCSGLLRHLLLLVLPCVQCCEGFWRSLGRHGYLRLQPGWVRSQFLPQAFPSASTSLSDPPPGDVQFHWLSFSLYKMDGVITLYWYILIYKFHTQIF